ncbi:tyramine beta-hydroxylase-like isoform X1 [Ostrea edulis]|uniref:tyramine beta-hydroxylase-like isoform X2 n=1 Tax=Ostrea edulis TaxID=37623 RepID=UPI0024AF066E|nr:tyramine beta-hydroxylase-like isoform X2 [Ostrea edulis]XP_056002010.1 tyramine beta-hydroxylase-like isoform X1 [Ostrea edulis]
MCGRISVWFPLFFTSCLGFKFLQTKIPNGDSVPHPCKPNYLWHGVGHRNELGGGLRNPFGEDFDASGKTWSPELCRKDSDGDGKTNGEELGDPNCLWRENAIPDKNAFSHPGVCEPYDSALCKPRNTWVLCKLEKFQCDAITEPDVENITLRYPPTLVPNQETNYFCMTFELPQDGDYHMIATQPYIDNEYVMHHILIFGCEESVTRAETVPKKCGMGSAKCRSIIAGWTLGQNGECMHEEVGFRIGKQGYKYAMMQFHWNNFERRSDYVDSSGMMLFYTPNRRPNDAITMTIGQHYLEIPPGKERVEIDAVCRGEDTRAILSGPIYVTEASNHMHYLGREEYIDQYRNGVKIHTISREPDYSYDRPRFFRYKTVIQVIPGDELKTKCVFKSSSKSVTTFQGDATSAEMCFGFLTIYPAKHVRLPFCTSWKSASMTKLRFNRVVNNCDMKVFSNASHPDMIKIYRNINTRCQPLSKCLEECKEVVKEIRLHPCMNGDVGEYMKWWARMSNDIDILTFFSKIESCDLEILREEMASQIGQNTNDGSKIDLHLLMLALMMLSLPLSYIT